ncbi:hypothetical protein V2J09_018486 [Rumex salicifolius]
MGRGWYHNPGQRSSRVCSLLSLSTHKRALKRDGGYNFLRMSWNQQMDFHYVGSSNSYGTAEGFMDYFEGFTYDHVNFIFSGTSQMQDSGYPHLNLGYYKFGSSESGSVQYSEGQTYGAYDHITDTNDLRGPVELSSNFINEQTMTLNQQSVGELNTDIHSRNRDCPRSHHNSHDYQLHNVLKVISVTSFQGNVEKLSGSHFLWQDYIDPDDMTYEELLELGETVGTHTRGLTQEQIALLPVSKFRCCFLRKKSQSERCVICQMNFKRGTRLLTLPCKHRYHVGCGSKWLSINKACPVCYTDVTFEGNTDKKMDNQ